MTIKKLISFLVLFSMLFTLICTNVVAAEKKSSDEEFVIEYGCLLEYKGTNEVITIPNNVRQISRIAPHFTKSNVKSIIIPPNVMHIITSAFYDLEELESIHIQENNKRFSSVDGVLYSKDKTNLIFYPISKKSETFSIDSATKNIENVAFTDNKFIQKVILGENVEKIGDSTFYNCSNLNSVGFNKKLTTVGNNAFDRCSNLKSVELPNSVIFIGDEAFSGCSSLENIELPTNISSIPNYLFSKCIKLQNVTIPQSVETIGNGAFASCNSLKQVTIPKNVNNIGTDIFFECSLLEEIIVEEGNLEYYSKDGLLYTKKSNILLKYPENKKDILFKATENTMALAYNAFRGAKNLKEIVLNDNFEFLPYGVFEECTSLEKIEIPNTVTSIGTSAFKNCYRLKSINIPKNIKKIDSYVFVNCDDLEEIVVDKDNLSYTSVDGVLYRKDMTTLVEYPNSKKDKVFIIPKTVNYIDLYALDVYSNLEEIIVENGNLKFESQDGVLFNKEMTELLKFPSANKRSFYQVPKSVEVVYAPSFYKCFNLTDLVVYDNVSYMTLDKQDFLQDFVIHCNENSSAYTSTIKNGFNYQVFNKDRVDFVYFKDQSYDVVIEKSTKLEIGFVPEDANNKKTTWTSSDDTIASVDENGVVTAKKLGTAVITATSENGGKVATCLVNVTEFLRGDTDNNGKIGTVDALLILRHTAAITPLNSEQLKRADIDSNGKVNTIDALMILKNIAGL